VASNPDLFVSDVFETGTDHGFLVDIYDPRQLLHFEALGIVFPNLFDTRNRVIKVDIRRINDELFTTHLLPSKTNETSQVWNKPDE
jgi:hypothetical protein